MRVTAEDRRPDVLRRKLSATYADFEIDEILEQVAEIEKLKIEKRAVVLGHNYMTPAVFHGVSDYVGDSLYLARIVAELPEPILLFNGVHFMAETAKIMSPNKKVLIADPLAGCSLAESITAQDVRNLKAQYPGVPVVTYVNCTAEVKAETDICCTSANALAIVEAAPGDTVIFLPDKFLAQNVARESRKKIITWEGKCMVHELYSARDIADARRHFTELTVISHPECPEEVVLNSDFAGSTSQMAQFIEKSPADNILLLTECSMADNLRHQFPQKHFVSTCQTCPHMKKITLEKIARALREEIYEIELDPEVIRRARGSVERMIELSK